MRYAFDILGVSDVLYLFGQQQLAQQKPQTGIEYIGSYQCTLDATLASVEDISQRRSWNVSEVVDIVVNFWMRNADAVSYWKQELDRAGESNLLVSRIADIHSFKHNLETLFGE
ncbi:MAG: hypothetical protein HC914_21845 [Chloroflexaceae bacterium]|nr:hypothetical protein [Chloroflexaceae bacterium]